MDLKEIQDKLNAMFAERVTSTIWRPIIDPKDIGKTG